MKELRVGVVGYCPPTRFDEVEARRMVVEAYETIAERFPGHTITVVSGLTNVGVLKIAYEEAHKRGWRTAGVACELAKDHEIYPVDEKVIVGNNWGDESDTFVASIQAIVRVGGGKQSKRETEQVKSRGLPAFEYELPML